MQDVPYQGMYKLCELVAEGVRSSVFTTRHAMTLAMRLFAWTCVPEYIPEQVQVRVFYGPLIKRVSKVALEALYDGLTGPDKEDLLFWWQSEGRLESLLWLLFVAWSLAGLECNNQRGEWMPSLHATPWFMAKLKETVAALNLETKKDFEDTLRVFPWVDHFCEKNFQRAWEQISRSSDVEDWVYGWTLQRPERTMTQEKEKLQIDYNNMYDFPN